jgi:hypothetical protein
VIVAKRKVLPFGVKLKTYFALHPVILYLAPSFMDPFGELRAVIAEVLTLVIQITAILLAIAIVTGFLEAQISYIVGAPSMLSALWFKIGAVIICFLIALTAVSISNTMVGILF